jgi:hypothetical protein
MDDRRRIMLARLALSDAKSSAALMLKAQAIDELVRNDVPVPVDRIREELQLIIGNRFNTYQSGRASRMALKIWEISENKVGSWPHPDGDAIVCKGYWPWDRDPPAADQGADEEWLYLSDDYGTRDRWHLALEPLPWDRSPD